MIHNTGGDFEEALKFYEESVEKDFDTKNESRVDRVGFLARIYKDKSLDEITLDNKIKFLGKAMDFAIDYSVNLSDEKKNRKFNPERDYILGILK